MSEIPGPSPEEIGPQTQNPDIERPEETPVRLDEVAPIKQSYRPIRKREDIRDIVETPLVTACEELYDKNVHTRSTSANKESVQTGFAYIMIDYDTLSPENQELGRQLGEVVERADSRELDVKIIIKNGKAWVSEIQKQAEEIAHRFKKQPMTWAPRYTLPQLKEIYGFGADEEVAPESFTDEYYYDQEGGVILFKCGAL